MKKLFPKRKGVLLLFFLCLFISGWYILRGANLLPPLFNTERVIVLETKEGFWVSTGSEMTIVEKGVFSIIEDWMEEKFSSESKDEFYKLILPRNKPVKINKNLSLTYKNAYKERIKLVDQNQGVHLLLDKKNHKNPFYGIILEIETVEKNQIRVKIYPKNNSTKPLSSPGV
ncbi:hypothetical protein K8R62_03410 [bacterium]|nr:hypothetical protein [bacterium]